jgi:lipopolysaccharide heptosyltransferase I
MPLPDAPVAPHPAPRVPTRPDPPRRVLIVKLSSLGDVVHALPLAEALRAGLGPDAHIGWAARSKFADLLRGNPHVSRAYELAGTGAGDLLAFGRTLRAENFDVALDAQGLLVSGLVARLSGARTRIGYDWGREGNRLLMTHPVVPARPRIHVVERTLGFCDALGLPRLAPRPQAYLAADETGRAAELLAGIETGSAGPLVGCIVGASTPEKAWPAERWAEMARLLAADGARVVLLGAKGEAEAAAAVEKQAGGAVAANLVGDTARPRELAAVLARCDVVVGGDSGPTHLAVALGVPVVGLYGVTDPARTGPRWGPAPAAVLDYAEADAPPESRRPRHPTVAGALARIPAAAAAEAARGLLAGAAAASRRKL